MPISPYLRELRTVIGSALVMMPGVAALIRDPEGRLLALQRADNGHWGLPAGALDPGGPAAEAVVREVLEETGLRVRPVHLAGVVGPHLSVYPNGDVVEYTVAVFVCEQTGGSLEARAGFAWRAAGELTELGYPAAVLAWQPGDPPYFDPPAG
ncbi:MAG: NUDIX domain-containing protein [Clostridia bacterium]